MQNREGQPESVEPEITDEQLIKQRIHQRQEVLNKAEEALDSLKKLKDIKKVKEKSAVENQSEIENPETANSRRLDVLNAALEAYDQSESDADIDYYAVLDIDPNSPEEVFEKTIIEEIFEQKKKEVSALDVDDDTRKAFTVILRKAKSVLSNKNLRKVYDEKRSGKEKIAVSQSDVADDDYAPLMPESQKDIERMENEGGRDFAEETSVDLEKKSREEAEGEKPQESLALLRARKKVIEGLLHQKRELREQRRALKKELSEEKEVAKRTDLENEIIENEKLDRRINPRAIKELEWDLDDCEKAIKFLEDTESKKDTQAEKTENATELIAEYRKVIQELIDFCDQRIVEFGDNSEQAAYWDAMRDIYRTMDANAEDPTIGVSISLEKLPEFKALRLGELEWAAKKMRSFRKRKETQKSATSQESSLPDKKDEAKKQEDLEVEKKQDFKELDDLAERSKLLNAKTHYEVLGIDASAGEDEIKKKYRALFAKYHPDKNPGDQDAETIFKKIAEAKECLLEKDKKILYNKQLDIIQGFEDALREYDLNDQIFSDLKKEFVESVDVEIRNGIKYLESLRGPLPFEIKLSMYDEFLNIKKRDLVNRGYRRVIGGGRKRGTSSEAEKSAELLDRYRKTVEELRNFCQERIEEFKNDPEGKDYFASQAKKYQEYYLNAARPETAPLLQSGEQIEEYRQSRLNKLGKAAQEIRERLQKTGSQETPKQEDTPAPEQEDNKQEKETKPRSLTEKLNELSENDPEGFEQLKKQLEGERVYRYVKGKLQYLGLENIEKQDDEWVATLVIYTEDKNGFKRNEKKGYKIGKTAYKERKKAQKWDTPVDGEKAIFRDNAGQEDLAEVEVKENDVYIFKPESGGGASVPQEELMVYEDEDEAASYSIRQLKRSQAEANYKKGPGPKKPSGKGPVVPKDGVTIEVETENVAPGAPPAPDTEPVPSSTPETAVSQKEVREKKKESFILEAYKQRSALEERLRNLPDSEEHQRALGILDVLKKNIEKLVQEPVGEVETEDEKELVEQIRQNIKDLGIIVTKLEKQKAASETRAEKKAKYIQNSKERLKVILERIAVIDALKYSTEKRELTELFCKPLEAELTALVSEKDSKKEKLLEEKISGKLIFLEKRLKDLEKVGNAEGQEDEAEEEEQQDKERFRIEEDGLHVPKGLTPEEIDKIKELLKEFKENVAKGEDSKFGDRIEFLPEKYWDEFNLFLNAQEEKYLEEIEAKKKEQWKIEWKGMGKYKLTWPEEYKSEPKERERIKDAIETARKNQDAHIKLGEEYLDARNSDLQQIPEVLRYEIISMLDKEADISKAARKGFEAAQEEMRKKKQATKKAAATEESDDDEEGEEDEESDEDSDENNEEEGSEDAAGIYKYKAMDTTGGEVEGTVDADSEEDAQKKIKAMGYFVTELELVEKKEKSAWGKVKNWFSWVGRNVKEESFPEGWELGGKTEGTKKYEAQKKEEAEQRKRWAELEDQVEQDIKTAEKFEDLYKIFREKNKSKVIKNLINESFSVDEVIDAIEGWRKIAKEGGNIAEDEIEIRFYIKEPILEDKIRELVFSEKEKATAVNAEEDDDLYDEDFVIDLNKQVNKLEEAEANSIEGKIESEADKEFEAKIQRAQNFKQLYDIVRLGGKKYERDFQILRADIKYWVKKDIERLMTLDIEQLKKEHLIIQFLKVDEDDEYKIKTIEDRLGILANVLENRINKQIEVLVKQEQSELNIEGFRKFVKELIEEELPELG